MSTFCPGDTFARSCSGSLAVTSTREVSTSSAMTVPGKAMSPGRNSGSTTPGKSTPPSAIMFWRTDTNPSNGARTRRVSMLRCATMTATCALLRFSRSTSVDAVVVWRRVFTSCSSDARRPRASSRSRRFCLAVIAPTSSLALASSSARRTRKARLEQRHLIVCCLHRGFRLGLHDFVFRQLQVEVRLFDGELLFRGIELHDSIAGCDRRTRFGERDDRLLTAHRRHGHLHGTRGPEVPDGVDAGFHAAALHVGGGDRRLHRREQQPAGDARTRYDKDCEDGDQGACFH